MPSGMVMAPRDGQRLAGKRKPRRRNKALHRAFLHASRNIALSRPRRATRGTLSGRRRRRGACAGTESRTSTGRPGTRWMRTTALSRTHRRTRLVLVRARHPGADAGRSACHAPACRLAELWEHRDAAALPAEPGTPDAVRSAERSNGAAHGGSRLPGTRRQAGTSGRLGQAVQDGLRAALSSAAAAVLPTPLPERLALSSGTSDSTVADVAGNAMHFLRVPLSGLRSLARKVARSQRGRPLR